MARAGSMNATALTLFRERMATPIGALLVVADEDGRACFVDFEDDGDRIRRLIPRYYGAGACVSGGRPCALVRDSLAAYFAGDLHAIDSIPVANPGTAFQGRVWSELRRIPAGQTISYGTLARRIGSPAAVRAVGLANGANPIAIIVPCHRVIGADGSLTGYGGGLARKRWLLAHEGAELPLAIRTQHP
jgi:methylated-DNA-[protein]-cysteine S-methyltransferase